jgi:hypothetical protein
MEHWFAVAALQRFSMWGFLGPRPSSLTAVVLSFLAWLVIVGFTVLAWKILAKSWPPKMAIQIVALFVAAKLILDLLRLSGLWFL